MQGSRTRVMQAFAHEAHGILHQTANEEVTLRSGLVVESIVEEHVGVHAISTFADEFRRSVVCPFALPADECSEVAADGAGCHQVVLGLEGLCEKCFRGSVVGVEEVLCDVGQRQVKHGAAIRQFFKNIETVPQRRRDSRRIDRL